MEGRMDDLNDGRLINPETQVSNWYYETTISQLANMYEKDCLNWRRTFDQPIKT